MKGLTVTSVVTFCLYGVGNSFFVPSNVEMQRARSIEMQGYRDQLQAARQAKGLTTVPQSVPEPSSSPRSEAHVVPSATVTSSSSSSNGLPFSDEMYEEIKFCIGQLTKRIKSKESLSPADISSLERSVHAIIADAREGGGLPPAPTAAISTPTPASSPEIVGIPQEPSSRFKAPATRSPLADGHLARARANAEKEGNTFSELAGDSSWVVPGMEEMNTEEYYKAVNARIQLVKEKRKNVGEAIGGQSVDNYFDKLNAANRSN
jgi:hypothetical protein